VMPVEKTAQTYATVIVKSGGKAFEASADSGQPAANLSAQRENLVHKFMVLTSPILGRGHAEALANATLDADRIPKAFDLIRRTANAGGIASIETTMFGGDRN
jgi:hypothetical protein